MPLHDFECPAGHVTEEVVGAGIEQILCRHCPDLAQRVFLRAPMGIVRPDIHYTSPIDGREITSVQARLEDLARSDCVPYEPGIKQDQERKRMESEAALERSVDNTVDREIALMPARKRERLEAELTGGLTAEPTRGTPAARPILTELVT